MKDYAFMQRPETPVQQRARTHFHLPLLERVMPRFNLSGGDMYAYQATGGSNLDLPDEAVDAHGATLSLERDVYPSHGVVLAISTHSATAPLTAHAKRHGFRGATLHGLNDTILASGLSADYNQVSATTEKLRLGLTRADTVDIDFVINDTTHTLTLELSEQEAQKSHGLCHGLEPDVANLPAGEVYFVPTGATGAFPMKYEDGTIGLQTVEGGRIAGVELIHGNPNTIVRHRDTLASDPVTGEIGELGFGTQDFPYAGSDIQDEKTLGTVHVATGRSDHLGGHLTPDLFAESQNASHDDILFHPEKTPEILVAQVRMHRDGDEVVLIEEYRPAKYMTDLLA